MQPDTSAAFFERLYQHGDPWQFATDVYEQSRYTAMIDAMLDGSVGARFRRAYEPGCAVGAFTHRLAEHCDEVVARDVSASAIAAARQACAAHPNVDLAVAAVDRWRPSGSFDLVVFSEIGYYFDAVQLEAVLEGLIDVLDEGGTLIGTHWTGTSPDHRISGDAVVRAVHRNPRLRGGYTTHDGYLLGQWTRMPDPR